MTEPKTFNLADLWEAVAERIPDRVAITCAGRDVTYRELDERASALAAVLERHGVGADDHVGVYLMNGPEYVETMLAAFKIRAVPINVNYRYVSDELRYLFDDAGLCALVAHRGFASRVAEVAGSRLRVHLSVDDDGTAVPNGSLDYEDAVASARGTGGPWPPRSNDDRYIIYTGGTTGMPKGVVWRHEDAFFACIGGGDPMRLGTPVERPAELLERIIDFDFTAFPLAPMMHAAAQWTSLSWLLCGARVVLHPGSFDAKLVWETVQRERVSSMIIVGDAMARPLVDEWARSGPYDVSSMYAVGSGGAPLSSVLRDRLHDALPNAMITDGFGSSETGAQGSQRIQPGERVDGVSRFVRLGEGTTVLADDLTEVEPGSGTVGRVALTGRIPLGYHNDPVKTAESFVDVGGRRWVLTGDAATVEADGSITLFGRGSQAINTGGEKVHPEEVEGVLKGHEGVYDALVVGVPDVRFGECVCAVVQPVSQDSAPTLEELAGHCRASLAGYKVPRRLVIVDEIQRSPVGKPDYRWASAVATRSG